MYRVKKSRNLAQIVRRPTSVSLADGLSRLFMKSNPHGLTRIFSGSEVRSFSPRALVLSYLGTCKQAMSHRSVGRAVGTLGVRHPTGAGSTSERDRSNFAFLPPPIIELSAQGWKESCGLIPWRLEGKKPEAHNPLEGCRWKTAVKNNWRRENLLNQPQKSLILLEGDGAPCNLTYWEEESKTRSAL